MRLGKPGPEECEDWEGVDDVTQCTRLYKENAIRREILIRRFDKRLFSRIPMHCHDHTLPKLKQPVYPTAVVGNIMRFEGVMSGNHEILDLKNCEALLLG